LNRGALGRGRRGANLMRAKDIVCGGVPKFRKRAATPWRETAACRRGERRWGARAARQAGLQLREQVVDGALHNRGGGRARDWMNHGRTDQIQQTETTQGGRHFIYRPPLDGIPFPDHPGRKGAHAPSASRRSAGGPESPHCIRFDGAVLGNPSPTVPEAIRHGLDFGGWCRHARRVLVCGHSD
jgi:hypothetical protein